MYLAQLISVWYQLLPGMMKAGQLFNNASPDLFFLDVAEGLHSTSVDESNVAGLQSSLAFELENKMKELPTFKYDQKNVSRTW